MARGTTVKELLDQREKELKESIADARNELKMVRAAREAVERDQPVKKLGVTGPTIKEMILHVLADKPAGETAESIIQLILRTFQKEVPRTSISPQLSRLKVEGRIVYLDEVKRWKQPDPNGTESNRNLTFEEEGDSQLSRPPTTH